MKKQDEDIKRALKLSEEIIEIMADTDVRGGIDDFPEFGRTMAENEYAGELLANLSDGGYIADSVNAIGDRESSERRLQKKIARQRSLRTARRIAAWSVSAAACVALLVVGVDLTRKSTTDGVVLAPGSGRATLTLADNRTVELNDTPGKTYEQNDARIFVGEEGLKYTPSSRNDMLIHNKLTVPRGGEYFVELADGTKVWLNAETQLRYPVDFVGDERRVFLSGEAYFEVTGDKSKAFIVETALGEVMVYGTEFNIKQYPDRDYIQATLVEGSVSFKSENVKETMLAPGYRLSYAPGSEPVLEKVNIEDQVAWKNKQFRFEEQNLYEIMTSLARWYDMDVVFSAEDLKKIELSGILNRSDDVRKLLNLFEETSNVRFVIEGRQVTVMQK